MNPVPLWFGVLCAAIGIGIGCWVLFRLGREWAAPPPEEYQSKIDEASKVYQSLHESVADPDEFARLFRMVISRAHARDLDAVDRLLEKMRDPQLRD